MAPASPGLAPADVTPTDADAAGAGPRDAAPTPGGGYQSIRWTLVMAALAVDVAIVRAVDRNFAIADQSGRPIDLHHVSSNVGIVAAAIAAMVLFALLFAYPAGRPGSAFMQLWRAATGLGTVAAAAKVLLLVPTLYRDEQPVVFSGLTTTALVVATLGVVVLWCVDSLTPGRDVRTEPTREATRIMRVNLVVAIAYAALALATPYAAPQVGDLLLAWSDRALPAASSFGVAAMLLFGLVLQESGIELRSASGGVRGRGPLRPAVRYGGAVVVVLLVALFLAPGTWDWWSLVVLLPLLVLGLSLWAESKLEAPDPAEAPSGAAFLAIAALPLLALAGALANALVEALFLFGPGTDYLLRGLLPAGALLLAVVLLAWTTPRVRQSVPELDAWWAAVAGCGGAVALAALAWWLVDPLLAGLIALAATVAYTALIRGPTRMWSLIGARIAASALVIGLLLDPMTVGRGVGTLGVIGIVVAGSLSLVHYLLRLFELVALPAPFSTRLHLKHVPIVALLALWVVVAFVGAPETRHDVALSAPTPTDLDGVSIDDAVDAWWTAQPDRERPRTGPDDALPLVLVAAEGGGIRASYWTAGVLDVLASGDDASRRLVALPDTSESCDPAASADQRQHAGRIFAISGASGGSVGAYAYARELQANGCLRPGWYAQWFARDLVGPTVGWGLAHDLPGVLLHQRPASDGSCTFDLDVLCDALVDRGRVLEDALDGDPAARELGLRRDEYANPWPVPHLVFNTSADDLRRRVTFSSLRLPQRPGVVEDALDARCAEGDVSWLSASFLSARFPLVTPSGRVVCAGRSVVDGGYLENTGLGSIAELLPAVARRVETINETADANGWPRVRIIVLELSNSPGARADPLSPNNAETPLTGPREALLGLVGLPTYPTRIARDDLRTATQAACSASPRVDVALLTVKPPLAPGWKAPVGWRLSRASRSELESALDATSDTGPTTLQRATALVQQPASAAGACKI